MIVIRDINDIPRLSSAFITIGFFDGFHIGHKKIIDNLLSLSQPHSKSIVVTFENHPLSIISPINSPKFISPVDYKLEFTENKGIDYLILLNFDEKIMKTKPIKFINYFLDKIKIVNFVVGSDFRFGYKNKGDITFLKYYSIKSNFKIFIVPPVIRDGLRVSSSIIRKFIIDGKIREANELLGRDFFIEGIVEHGDGKGKKIGFPTINIVIGENILSPKFGVYKGYVFVENIKYDCFIFVSNFKLGKVLDKVILEAYIKDFYGDLYGKKVRIFFQHFIRDVIKFENTEALVAQIYRDIKTFSSDNL